jgi:hypothetical protein
VATLPRNLSRADLRLQQRALQESAADDLLDSVLARRKSMSALVNPSLFDAALELVAPTTTTHDGAVHRARTHSRDHDQPELQPQMSHSHSRRHLAPQELTPVAAKPRSSSGDHTVRIPTAVTEETADSARPSPHSGSHATAAAAAPSASSMSSSAPTDTAAAPAVEMLPKSQSRRNLRE